MCMCCGVITIQCLKYILLRLNCRFETWKGENFFAYRLLVFSISLWSRWNSCAYLMFDCLIVLSLGYGWFMLVWILDTGGQWLDLVMLESDSNCVTVSLSLSIFFVLSIPFLRSGQWLEIGAVILLFLYAFMVLKREPLPFLFGKFKIF
jgi:hypothetical protein